MTGALKLELVPVTQPSAEASELQADRPPTSAEPAGVSPEPAPDPEPAGPELSEVVTALPDGESAPGNTPWRRWGSFDRTVSYRLPPELVAELEERLYQLRLPAGLSVAAALTALLDLDDAELQAAVTRAEAAKPRRRRPGGR